MDLETAFAQHHSALFRYLHRLVGDPDVADDIAQEAFVRLLDQALPDGKVRSWLFTVATNLVRDRARARARRDRLLSRPEAQPERAENPADRTERRERIDRVRAALDELSERDRELLLMREEGFRYADIAEVIGVAPSSVGTLVARALQRFESAYRDQWGTDGGASGEDEDRGTN